MLRSFLIYLSKAPWAQNLIMSWPFAWKVASRFVAGQNLTQAIAVVNDLNKTGINATLDHLGEHTSTAEEASQATADIIATLDEIQRSGVRANISIKLTQIGVGLDEALCRDNLLRILQRGREHRIFVRIDMEDTPYTDVTLALYSAMLERGFTPEHFGLVTQAYLLRSEADLKRLLEMRTRVRIVKGAYNEPPEKAFPKKADTDANYDLLVKLVLDQAGTIDYHLSADGRTPALLAVATHDDKRIQFATSYAAKLDLPKDMFEFQMLYGIRRDAQTKLVKDGYSVRVYVPFGTRWYPYFMRRLAERPANIWFFVSNFLRG